MQARPERRAARRLRHGGYDAPPAGRTAHRQTPMMRDEGLHLGQLDPLVDADRLGQQVRAERHSTAGALARTVLDNRIGRLAHHPAVALMAGLGPAGLGFLPLLLAIRRGWLGGGARGLLRPLQAQHQLDQLFLAQTLKLNTTHLALESANTPSLKRVGNCGDSLTSPTISRVPRDVVAPDNTKCLVWRVVKIELLWFSTRRLASIMRHD